MAQLAQLVEYVIPMIFDLRSRPFWVAFYGDWRSVDLDDPGPGPDDEPEAGFQVLQGDFWSWWPDPDCSAILIVAASSSTAPALRVRGKDRARPPRRFKGWHPGYLFLAVSADDETYAVEVGDDGPRLRGVPQSGYGLDLVRAKFGFGPGPGVDGPADFITLTPC